MKTDPKPKPAALLLKIRLCRRADLRWKVLQILWSSQESTSWRLYLREIVRDGLEWTEGRQETHRWT